jgi:hypothetical protein
MLDTERAEPLRQRRSRLRVLRLGGTVAPFAESGVESCTVKPGTKVFVAAQSVECSTFERNGTVPVVEVETPLLNIVLPADNIFDQPAGTQGLSVGHGWVALLHPLTPGTHTIVIDTAGSPLITTTIVVQPGG